MDSLDLQGKYHKLASEYSKLKAQNQVLKKAVIEEQAKTGELKDSSRTNEQSLRKAEQEIDSLTFRNQQLIKRLSLLQQDLEVLKSKPKKGQHKIELLSSTASDKKVLEEELQCKIEENARLHAELTDLNVLYMNKLSEFDDKLKKTTQEAEECFNNSKSRDDSLEYEIKRLENDIIIKELQLQQKDSKILSLENELKQTNLTQTNCIEENVGQIKTQSSISSLNGSFSKDFDQNIVSVRDVKSSLENFENKTHEIFESTEILFKSFLEPIKDLSASFVNFFDLFFELTKKTSFTFHSSQEKYTNELLHEKKTFGNLSVKYEDICKNTSDVDGNQLTPVIVGFNEFSKCVLVCATSLRKILPVLSDKNYFNESQNSGPWRSSLGRFVSAWSAMNPYINSLVSHTEGRSTLSECALKNVLNLLHERLNKLHLSSKDIASSWESLQTEDSKIQSDLLKSFSDIEIALSQISSNLNKLINRIDSKNIPVSSTSSIPIDSRKLSPSPSVSSSLYFNSGNESQDNRSIDSLSTQQLGHSHTDENLHSLTALKLSEAEKEKEHWKLEYQLLLHKLEKEKSDKKFESEHSDALDGSSDANTQSSFVESASIVAEVSVSPKESSVGSREQEIRDHFTSRCSQLYMQLTQAANQASFYQNECEKLLARLLLSEETAIKAEKDIDEQRKNYFFLQENLQTTARNYEEQISTMSDHLADLTEKVTMQAELIGQLQFENKKKGKK